jgi:hypothetical protein
MKGVPMQRVCFFPGPSYDGVVWFAGDTFLNRINGIAERVSAGLFLHLANKTTGEQA